MNKTVNIKNIPAYHSYPDKGGKHPGLIVIHEIWGLIPNIKNISDRFAKEGYSVLAPDLFFDTPLESLAGEKLFKEAQDPETRDEAQKKMREQFGPMRSPEFAKQAVNKLKDCFEYLLDDENVNGNIGVLGFCFGGTYSFALAAAEQRIKASVPFYGQPLEKDKIPNLNCPVLAFYGEQDTRLIETLPELKENMKIADKNFEAIVYPNCGHAFMNENNTRMYNKEAADDAWKKTLEFLSKNLK